MITSGHNINTIVKHSGRYYAFDGYPFLSWPNKYQAHGWEVVGSAQNKVYTLKLHNTSAILGMCLPTQHVLPQYPPLIENIDSSRVHENTLYQFHGAYGMGYLAKYSLPFSGTAVAPTEEIKLPNQIQEIPAIFDFNDNVAFALVSRCMSSPPSFFKICAYRSC